MSVSVRVCVSVSVCVCVCVCLHRTVTARQRQLLEDLAAEEPSSDDTKTRNSVLQDAIDRIKKYVSGSK